MRRILSLSFATLLGLVACGRGAAGPGDVVGTIDSISASSIQGTFDVIMSSGDHVTGSFDAANCPALDTWNNTTPATCM